MSELNPIAQQHPHSTSGIVAGPDRRPVIGETTADSAAAVTFSSVASPSRKLGESCFQNGFEPIPVEGGS